MISLFSGFPLFSNFNWFCDSSSALQQKSNLVLQDIARDLKFTERLVDVAEIQHGTLLDLLQEREQATS